jgi:hypothetical protein
MFVMGKSVDGGRQAGNNFVREGLIDADPMEFGPLTERDVQMWENDWR